MESLTFRKHIYMIEMIFKAEKRCQKRDFLDLFFAWYFPV